MLKGNEIEDIKMSWKNININKNNIKNDTGRAVLIAMPHSSSYDGYVFWHPSQLVRDGRNSASVSIGYNDEFKFHLKKYGKGKTNYKDVLDEVELDSSEFEEEFGIINENITAPAYKDDYETHKPTELKAEKVDVLEELKDE